MNLTIALAISIICCIISVCSFALNRKDKSNDNVSEEARQQGKIEEKLSNIEKTLIKIEDKLNYYDTEIDKRIDKAISNHINIFHSKEK